jgi:hypothetical protein
VLAGAFLLRAATDGGQLPRPLGIALGLAYALAWLPAARRAARRGDARRATFHAAASMVIAYPLLFEATARFHVLGATTGALGLAAVSALMLHTAWRQRSPAVAWLVMVATFATSEALAVVTRAPAPFAALLVGFAGAALMLGEQRGWRALSWVCAAVADLAVLVVTLLAQLPDPPVVAWAALTVQLALLLLYLGFTTHLGRRHAAPSALVVQTAVAVVIGWGGALVTGRAAGGTALTLGLLGLLLATVAEAQGLRLPPAASPALRPLLLGSALAFALGGSLLLLPQASPAWALMAVAASLLGAQGERDELRLQGALLAAATVAGSSALATASSALLRPTTVPTPWSLAAGLALLAAIASLAVLARARPPRGRAHATAVTLLLALLAWVLPGALLAVLAPPLGDAGLSAALGTALLALAVTALARLAQREPWRAARRLVYPLLLVAILKVVAVDLMHGRAIVLFLSFAALGGASLVAARSTRAAERSVATEG